MTSSAGTVRSGTSSQSPADGSRASWLSACAQTSLASAATWVAVRSPFDDAVPSSIPVAASQLGCAFATLWLLSLSGARRGREYASWSRALRVGLMACLPFTTALAWWLIVRTHHRPLGAVTFAVGSSLAGVVAVSVSKGLLERLANHRRLAQAIVWSGSAAAIVGAGMAATALGGPVLDWDSALLLDLVCALSLGLLVLKCPTLVAFARLQRLALPLGVLLCAVSLWFIRSDAEVRAAVKSAPILGGPLALPFR